MSKVTKISAIIHVCFSLLGLISFSSAFADSPSSSNKVQAGQYYLDLLHVVQNDQSKDYVNNKKQFQLHTLITEQPHPATTNLTITAKENPSAALSELLSVDHDINAKITSLKADTNTTAKIQQAVAAIKNAILQGNKIYVYGTGSTGRLAKQIENIWKTFWLDAKSRSDWPKIAEQLKDIPHLDNIQNSVIGEITGGDRALIRSLEGFEDLQLIGKLQLEDNHINSKDVVFAVTEGGETSAVIGTILTASQLSGSQSTNLYFVYNNPDNLLLPFDRSREVLQNNKITKINFTTGKQAITGSTRMQATSSQTFLISTLIEQALTEIFKERLSDAAMKQLGFNSESTTVLGKLNQFKQLQADVEKQKTTILDAANAEYEAYQHQNHTIYFGNKLLTTLFIDVTERAPTFNLAPLDTVKGPRLSWIDVYTNAENLDQAWKMLLFRDFKGLEKDKYATAFEENITDPYLKETAIKSLDQATYEQKFLYDLSMANLDKREYNSGDVAISYLLVDEVEALLENNSPFKKWLSTSPPYKIYVVLVGLKSQTKYFSQATEQLKKVNPTLNIKPFILSAKFDPLQIQRKIALKLFLNTQSTFIMASLERVLGNSMIFVYPSNLKLVGRATYLTELHINRILADKPRFSNIPPIDYNQSNAILFDASQYIESHQLRDKVAIIPLVIVRVFQALQQQPSSWEDAQKILSQQTLSEYIAKI